MRQYAPVRKGYVQSENSLDYGDRSNPFVIQVDNRLGLLVSVSVTNANLEPIPEVVPLCRFNSTTGRVLQQSMYCYAQSGARWRRLDNAQQCQFTTQHPGEVEMARERLGSIGQESM